MKECKCPYCGKTLIRFEPFEPGIYNFWCDTCDVDIRIKNNNEINFTKKENENE